MIAGKLSPEEMRRLRAKLPIGPGVAQLNQFDPDTQTRHEIMDKQKLVGIRPTTDEAKLNKTEKDYLAWLKTQGDFWIGVQCITLKLGHDCRLTVDFWALDSDGLRAIDTKGGHTWEDSLIKLRCAARMYPFVRFLIAKKENGVWSHKEIKP